MGRQDKIPRAAPARGDENQIIAERRGKLARCGPPGTRIRTTSGATRSRRTSTRQYDASRNEPLEPRPSPSRWPVAWS